jgi:hypothetical protein
MSNTTNENNSSKSNNNNNDNKEIDLDLSGAVGFAEKKKKCFLSSSALTNVLLVVLGAGLVFSNVQQQKVESQNQKVEKQRYDDLYKLVGSHFLYEEWEGLKEESIKWAVGNYAKEESSGFKQGDKRHYMHAKDRDSYEGMLRQDYKEQMKIVKLYTTFSGYTHPPILRMTSKSDRLELMFNEMLRLKSKQEKQVDSSSDSLDLETDNETEEVYSSSNQFEALINKEGKKQLGANSGNSDNPVFAGFNTDEIKKLDFSKIDFSEFIEAQKLKLSKLYSDGSSNKAGDKKWIPKWVTDSGLDKKTLISWVNKGIKPSKQDIEKYLMPKELRGLSEKEMEKFKIPGNEYSESRMFLLLKERDLLPENPLSPAVVSATTSTYCKGHAPCAFQLKYASSGDEKHQKLVMGLYEQEIERLTKGMMMDLLTSARKEVK